MAEGSPAGCAAAINGAPAASAVQNARRNDEPGATSTRGSLHEAHGVLAARHFQRARAPRIRGASRRACDVHADEDRHERARSRERTDGLRSRFGVISVLSRRARPPRMNAMVASRASAIEDMSTLWRRFPDDIGSGRAVAPVQRPALGFRDDEPVSVAKFPCVSKLIVTSTSLAHYWSGDFLAANAFIALNVLAPCCSGCSSATSARTRGGLPACAPSASSAWLRRPSRSSLARLASGTAAPR